MSDFPRVSTRMIQRARLGELDEGELSELVAQLEREDGNADRLEQAILADRRFLEAHPPQEMAPLIRHRLERRKRERETSSEGETMLSMKRMFWRPATTALIAGALGVVLTVLFMDGKPDREPAAPVPAELVPADAPTPVAGTPPISKEFAARLSRRLSPLNELVLSPGEQLRVDARGMKRVEVDRTDVVPPPIVSDDKSTFDFVASEPGLTGVRFHYDDGGLDLLYVRVAPEHDAELAGGISSQAPAADVCDELAASSNLRGEIWVRALTTPVGNVATAYVERSTAQAADDVEQCLLDVALQATFAATEGSRTALYMFSYPVE